MNSGAQEDPHLDPKLGETHDYLERCLARLEKKAGPLTAEDTRKRDLRRAVLEEWLRLVALRISLRESQEEIRTACEEAAKAEAKIRDLLHVARSYENELSEEYSLRRNHPADPGELRIRLGECLKEADQARSRIEVLGGDIRTCEEAKAKALAELVEPNAADALAALEMELAKREKVASARAMAQERKRQGTAPEEGRPPKMARLEEEEKVISVSSGSENSENSENSVIIM